MVTRRRFLTQTGSIGLVPWLITSAGCGSSASGDKEPSGAPPDVGAAFLHGVASGDPLADGVILWTRVTLEGDGAKGEPVDVDWRIGLDPEVYDPDTGRGSLGVEIIVPGVTSPGIRDRAEAARSEERYREMAPHLAFTEQHSQGYVIVDLTHERARAEWHFVSSVRQPEALERLGGAVQVGAGENHLIPA